MRTPARQPAPASPAWPPRATNSPAERCSARAAARSWTLTWRSTPSCAACAARHAASRVRRPDCVTRLHSSADRAPAELAERTVTYAGAPEVRSRWRLQQRELVWACVAPQRRLTCSRMHRCSCSGLASSPCCRTGSACPRWPRRALASAQRHVAHSRAAFLTSHALGQTQVDEECISCGHRGLSFHTMQASRQRTVARSNNALALTRCFAARAATLGGRGPNRVL